MQYCTPTTLHLHIDYRKELKGIASSGKYYKAVKFTQLKSLFKNITKEVCKGNQRTKTINEQPHKKYNFRYQNRYQTKVRQKEKDSE